ncbi:MAG: beta/gamma crystallin family protein [Sphingopyxis sp.]|nr:beta/gamma crystallin family protein [Sphingopyxis sp.]
MKYIAAIAAAALLPAALVSAQGAPPTKSKTEANTLRLFKGQTFGGEMYDVDRARPSLQLEMTVGSIAVHPGEKWEVCDKPRFKGTCNIVDADMANMGTVAIQSVRPVKQ